MGLRVTAAAAVAAALILTVPASAQWPGYDGYRPYPRDYSPYPPFPGGGDPSYEPQPQPPGGNQQLQPQGDQGFGFTPPPGNGDQGAGGGYMPGGPMDDAQAAASPRTAQVVQNPTGQPAGTIVVDTASRHLYYVQQDGTAIEYGIGVGREGFAWKGVAYVGRKSEWPRWFPPEDMLKRRPDLPTEMDGGMNNPLGARALYLFENNKDTLFRIHGTNEPDTIGKAVSSGCIRMMNADVMDLFNRVPVGTRVVVL